MNKAPSSTDGVLPGSQEKLYRYRISGLNVGSTIELASAMEVTVDELAAVQTPDVVLHSGTVPLHLDAPSRSGDGWEVQGDSFLLHLNSIGSFLMHAGQEITFELADCCDARTASLYLMGTCFAILLQQRGSLVLHASAIAVDGRAMLFCGQSGAGKSTMAAMLCRRGYALVNDDVCNLRRAEGDRYEVRSDGRMLKLWSESMDELQLNQKPEMAVRADVNKYFHAPPVSRMDAQVVRAIYILHESAAGEPAFIRKIRPLSGMVELQRNAYRPALIAAMDMEQFYFEASAALQRSAGIYQLSRPKDFSASEELLDMVEDHWKTMLAEAKIEAN